jgi:hypothetical protein
VSEWCAVLSNGKSRGPWQFERFGYVDPAARVLLKLCEREERVRLLSVFPELPSSWLLRGSYRASVRTVLRHRSVR